MSRISAFRSRSRKPRHRILFHEQLEDRSLLAIIITNSTNINLANSQIEVGGDTSDNPNVVNGAVESLLAYSASASAGDLGGLYGLPNLNDGDIGVGIPSDGTYAIPFNGTLTLSFGGTQTISSIAIYNGYGNRDDGTYLLQDAANNTLGGYTISGSGPFNPFNNGVDSFWLTFTTPVTTTALKLTFAVPDFDNNTASFREIQVFGPALTAGAIIITDSTNINLANSQVEIGDDTSDNPNVVNGAVESLLAYSASASAGDLGGPYGLSNLNDGDIGVGIPSDGTYAIPFNGTLTLSFGGIQTISSIAIYNGYGNRDDGTYLLQDAANNTLGGYTISGTGGHTNNGVDSFWLTFTTPVTTNALKLTFAVPDFDNNTASFREIQVFGPAVPESTNDVAGSDIPSGVSMSGSILRFNGGDGADVVTVSNGNLVVNGTVYSLAGVTEVRIWGRGENDQIDLSDLGVRAFINGGNGNDAITGGSSDDVIFGEAGDDTITGAAGNDFLIGGVGKDRLVGSAGNDILVAGDVDSTLDILALQAISQEWAASHSTSEAESIDSALDETLDDGNSDLLTGGAGADLFIINWDDRITDFQTGKPKTNKDGDVVIRDGQVVS